MGCAVDLPCQSMAVGQNGLKLENVKNQEARELVGSGEETVMKWKLWGYLWQRKTSGLLAQEKGRWAVMGLFEK